MKSGLISFIILFWMITTPSLSPGEEKSLYFLQLKIAETKEVLLSFPVQGGDRFYLYYIHSSDKTPILDTFLIEAEGQLVLIEEAYRWYGAGLEFQNHGDINLIHGKQWVKVRLRRTLNDLYLRVGRVAQQVFIYENQYVPLDSLVRPGEAILISVNKEIGK